MPSGWGLWAIIPDVQDEGTIRYLERHGRRIWLRHDSDVTEDPQPGSDRLVGPWARIVGEETGEWRHRDRLEEF